MDKLRHELSIRVRYSETDAMGYLHHSNHPVFFEMGRTELFRSQGGDYRALEEQGLFFVVTQLRIRYRKPARYDDRLTVVTTLEKQGAAKLDHSYRLLRGDELIAEAESTIACVDKNGQVQMIADDLYKITSTD